MKQQTLRKKMGRPKGAKLTGRLASAVLPLVEKEFRRIAAERHADLSDIVREAAQAYLATYQARTDDHFNSTR